jgi:hypothetical protein
VESKRQYGIDLVGPIVEDFSWQAKAGKGFATSDFTIDWENKRAVCPQGKLSRGWQVARPLRDGDHSHPISEAGLLCLSHAK